jgi:hypothetical protein
MKYDAQKALYKYWSDSQFGDVRLAIQAELTTAYRAGLLRAAEICSNTECHPLDGCYSEVKIRAEAEK